MGSVFFYEETLQSRVPKSGQCDLSVLDCHGVIEIRVGPVGHHDGPNSYVLELTAAQTRALAEALTGVADRLGSR